MYVLKVMLAIADSYFLYQKFNLINLINSFNLKKIYINKLPASDR